MAVPLGPIVRKMSAGCPRILEEDPADGRAWGQSGGGRVACDMGTVWKSLEIF